MKSHLIAGLLLAYSFLTPLPASSQSSNSQFPLTTFQGTLVPDWSRISFDTFGGMQSAGQFIAPPELTQAIGFDASVSWQQGTPLSEVIRLGFVDQAFGLQQLSLAEIGSEVGFDANSLPLSDYQLLERQTLGSLVYGTPGLENFQVYDVPAIAELVGFPDDNPSLGQLVAADPSVAELPLDPILDRYSIGDIPGLAAAPIEGFALWQQSFIGEIPGLSSLPFDRFPSGFASTLFVQGVALLNLPLSGEGFIGNVISGSDRQGFRVDCDQPQPRCNNIELGQPFLGARWIVGSDQSVRGGHNLLSAVNGGREPTGRMFIGNRNPEREPFKLILNSVNDERGEATFGLAMHFCIHHRFPDPLPNPDCTPYWIQFKNLFTFREKDYIYIGAEK